MISANSFCKRRADCVSTFAFLPFTLPVTIAGGEAVVVEADVVVHDVVTVSLDVLFGERDFWMESGRTLAAIVDANVDCTV